MDEKRMWMVRAGEGSRLIDDFKDKEVIGIGWNELGDISGIKNPKELKDLFVKVYPEASKGQVDNNSGQINRFLNKFRVGDKVLTYDSTSRVYFIGEIVSEYEYNTKLFEYNHIRRVRWDREVERDALTTQTKNTLGSTLSIFKINSFSQKDLAGALKPTETEDTELEETLDEIKEDIESRAIEFIKDKASALDWKEMEHLVAGLLRSMGYKTRITSKGGDRGKDIIASPDGLGLEDPRILIEVKHRKGKMGAPDLRSFLGGLRANEKGVYVSTGGFSQEAKYEAERANHPIICIDIDMLVQMIIQYYDEFDLETKALLPLRKIYWPIE